MSVTVARIDLIIYFSNFIMAKFYVVKCLTLEKFSFLSDTGIATDYISDSLNH